MDNESSIRSMNNIPEIVLVRLFFLANVVLSNITYEPTASNNVKTRVGVFSMYLLEPRRNDLVQNVRV